MSETMPYTNGSYSTEQTYTTTLSAPTFTRGRAASPLSGHLGSPGLNNSTGADTCEDLLFKVIARIHGMKLERESLTSNIGELHARIKQLEATVAQQAQELESRRAEIEHLKQAQVQWADTCAICLIDGDGYIFEQKLLVNGYEGGREAAASLTKQLHQDLGNASTGLWICVYYNHLGLKKVLSRAQIVSEAVFDDFCDGFRSSSQLVHMMDVGRRKEAADEKIKEMLRMFTAAPQTKTVYFGGGHDSGYAGALSRYQNLGLEDKIVILKGYDAIAYDLRNLPFRIMDMEGLFMSEKVELDAQLDNQAQVSQRTLGCASSNRTTPPATASYALAATLGVPFAVKSRSPSPSHVRHTSRDAGKGGQRRIDILRVSEA
ncbi:Zinc finger protein, partial [Rhizoctonia solani]